MPRQPNLEYVRKEPKFLAQFKAQTGYVEHDVNDKKAKLEREKRAVDREEEEPQVVQLNSDHLSAEQAKTFLAEQRKAEQGEGDPDAAAAAATSTADNEEEEQPPADGKIRFKKPKKRESSDLDLNVRKKQKGEKDSVKRDRKQAVKNTKLLSFDDEEDDG